MASRELHSEARKEGICNYRLWNTEELIEAYAFEECVLHPGDRYD